MLRKQKYKIIGILVAVFVASTSLFPAFAAVPYPANDVLGQEAMGIPDFTSFDTNNISAPNNSGFSSANDVVVDTVNHKLFVSDGGNNRVVVYELDVSNNLTDRIADYVLGQSNFSTKAFATSQAGLDDPHALALDSNRSLLFVADQDNNRVIVYDYGTLSDGEDAVYVLGQATFSTKTTALSQSGMNTPAALAFDTATDYLYVGESANQRILVYDTTSITNGENALYVLGAPDFTTGSGILTSTDIGNIEGLAVDSLGQRLFASDNTFRRTLVYDISSVSNGEAAVNVLGAPDFTTWGESSASQSSTYTPGDLAYDTSSDYLYSVSISNRRISIFDVASITNQENAIKVIGQPDFTSTGYYSDLAGVYPGGIEVSNNKLYSVNRGSSNRVEIFSVTAITNGENFVDVLGQTDGNGNANFYSYSANDQHPNTIGLSSPSQMVVDETNHRLYIVDTYNYRIVVHNLSTTNEIIDYEADAVLGQTDFTSNVYESTVQNRLLDPSGIALDTKSQYLYVADTANSRVVVFDVGTITDGEDAIFVLGAPDFTTYNNDLTAAGLRYPTHVEVDEDRQLLFVSDYLENRVLVYDTTSLSNGMDASYVLGQPDFVTNNDGVTTQSSLDRPIASTYDSTTKYLFVSDETNSRVLVYDTTSLSNGMDASYVLGQPDFVTSDYNSAAANTVATPGYSDIDTSSRSYYVWDYGRILAFDISSISNNESAVGVIGQMDFVTEDYLAPTQAALEGGVGLFFAKQSAKLYASDIYNERMLVFDLARTTTSSLPSTQEGQNYSKTLSYEDNQGSVTYSLESGSLPSGISLSSTGLLSGTSTEQGTFPITVRLTDNNGAAGSFTTVQDFSLKVTGPDADGDGVENLTEDAGPNGGDANGDGTADSEQVKVSTNENSVATGYTTIETNSGSIENFSVVDEISLPTQSPENFPLGLNEFAVSGLAVGETVNLTVYYDQEYDTSGWVFMKYNRNTQQYTDISDLVSYTTKNVGGNNITTVSYSVTDGGLYDEDGVANGTIVDPAGPAFFELARTGSPAYVSFIFGISLIATALSLSKVRTHRKIIL